MEIFRKAFGDRHYLAKAGRKGFFSKDESMKYLSFEKYSSREINQERSFNEAKRGRLGLPSNLKRHPNRHGGQINAGKYYSANIQNLSKIVKGGDFEEAKRGRPGPLSMDEKQPKYLGSKFGGDNYDGMSNNNRRYLSYLPISSGGTGGGKKTRENEFVNGDEFVNSDESVNRLGQKPGNPSQSFW